MIVFAAIWIEGWSAIRTLIIWIHILSYCKFRSTNPTKNCFCIPFFFFPKLRRMIGCFLMTLKTGIIFFTTLEFYSNNIKRWIIVLTAGFIINKLSIYFDLIHFAAKVRNDLRKKKFLWINCNISETNPSNDKWIVIPGKIPQTVTLWIGYWVARPMFLVLLLRTLRILWLRSYLKW